MLFSSLSPLEKISFFLKCQEILTKNHPESEFIFREDNVQDRLSFTKEFMKKYKGFAYWNDHVCVLYNKVYIKDTKDPATTVKLNMYKEPSENFNCYIIDFAVFDGMENVRPFIQEQYNARIEYLIWVKHNEIKLYHTKNLLDNLERLAKLPKIIFQ